MISTMMCHCLHFNIVFHYFQSFFVWLRKKHSNATVAQKIARVHSWGSGEINDNHATFLART